MIKSTVYLVASKLITFVSTLLCNKLLVNLFDASSVGTYEQILLVINLNVFFLIGIPEAIVYFFSKRSNAKNNGLKKSLYMLLAAISLISFALVFFASNGLACYFHNDALLDNKWQLAVMLSLSLFSSCFPSICVSYGTVSKLVVVNVISALLKLIVFVTSYSIQLSLSNVVNLVTMVYVVTFTMEVGLVISLEKKNGDKPSPREDIRRILGYSLPLFVTVIIGKLTVYTDKLMINWFFDTETYAYYAVAARELPYTLITASLITVMTPRVYKLIDERRVDQAVSLWSESMRYSFLFISFAVASNIVMADDLIRFLYSDEYLSAQSVFIVYLIALFPRIAYWGIFARAYNKAKYILLTSIVELVINFALNFVFLKTLGVIGAAIATVIASFTSVAMWICINRKITRRSINELLPLAAMGKSLIINIALAVIFFLLKTTILNDVVHSAFIRLAIVATLWGGVEYLIYRRDVLAVWRKVRDPSD